MKMHRQLWQRQRRRAASRPGEAGYVLLVVIFLVAMVLIALAIAAPKWKEEIQRDREVELNHRGMQYAHAIKLYYKKFGNYPTNINQLMNTNNIKFLRKKYADPITGQQAWRPVYFGMVGTGGNANCNPNNSQSASSFGGTPGGNSGVKYLVKEGKSGKAGVGFEYQVLDDEKNDDSKNGANRQAGALYYLIAPNKSKQLKPVGEFNQSEIIVRGQHVEHWLNGTKIVECDLGSPELKEDIAKSKFSKITWFGQKRPTVILLQDHGDTVWFRNLKIKTAQG